MLLIDAFLVILFALGLIWLASKRFPR